MDIGRHVDLGEASRLELVSLMLKWNHSNLGLARVRHIKVESFGGRFSNRPVVNDCDYVGVNDTCVIHGLLDEYVRVVRSHDIAVQKRVIGTDSARRGVGNAQCVRAI